MADFIFDKNEGTFSGHGQTWHAVSGSRSIFKPLAPGIYNIPAEALMTGKEGFGVTHHSKYDDPLYTDEQGFCWFLWLGKGVMGIHPDGDSPGRVGCIGITDPDTKGLFELFKSLNHEALTVEVK